MPTLCKTRDFIHANARAAMHGGWHVPPPIPTALATSSGAASVGTVGTQAPAYGEPLRVGEDNSTRVIIRESQGRNVPSLCPLPCGICPPCKRESLRCQCPPHVNHSATTTADCTGQPPPIDSPLRQQDGIGDEEQHAWRLVEDVASLMLKVQRDQVLEHGCAVARSCHAKERGSCCSHRASDAHTSASGLEQHVQTHPNRAG